MVTFESQIFEPLLVQADLLIPVIVIKYRLLLVISTYGCYWNSSIQRDIPSSQLFGELGMVIHEMEERSGLHQGNIPYEERVPLGSELDILGREESGLCDVYWEVLWHFFIFKDREGERNHRVTHVAWANYLFPGVEVPGPVMNLSRIYFEYALGRAHLSKGGAV